MSTIKLSTENNFSWLNNKKEIIASSPTYKTKTDCLNAIESLKKDAASAAIENQTDPSEKKRPYPKFVITKSGSSYTFSFAISSSKTILTSKKYSSLKDCSDDIEEIKQNIEDVYNNFQIEQNIDQIKPLLQKKVSKDSITIKRQIRSVGLRKKPAFKAQKATPTFADKNAEIKKLETINASSALTIESNNTKNPSFITGHFTESKITSSKTAISALNNLHHIMGFKNAEQEFKEASVNTLQLGASTTFYRLQQYHEGIPVFGRQLVICVNKDGIAESLSGHYSSITTTTEPKFTEDKAQALIQKEDPNSNITLEGLHYYVDSNDKSTLCWKISTENYEYFISAVNGNLIKKLPLLIDYGRYRIDSANDLLGQSVEFPYYKIENTKYLYDTERNILIKRCNAPLSTGINVSTTTNWDNDTDAITAFNHIIKTYDYYKNALNWKGADNKGRRISVTVDYYKENNNRNHDNAYSSTLSDETRILLGNARGDYSRALDVIGHEFTHSVNRCCGWNPIYENESGALDEAIADIMGEFVQDGTFDEIGEQLNGHAFRSFANPQVDSYSKRQPYTDEPNGNYDHGYVHANSCIISHAFYLMQNKWPSNTFSAEMPAAVLMAIQTLSPDSSFLQFRSALVNSARILDFGSRQIQAIMDSFDEVEVQYKQKNSGIFHIKGRIVDQSGNPISDAEISANYKIVLLQIPLAKAHTDSNGNFTINCILSGQYVLHFSASAFTSNKKNIRLSNQRTINIGDVTLKATQNQPNTPCILQGTIKNYETNKVESNVSIRIIKGSNYQKALAGFADYTLTTDANGCFSTTALPSGTYMVLAYKSISSKTQCLMSLTTIYISHKITLNLLLRRTNRYFIDTLSISSAKSKNSALNALSSSLLKIEKDLNKGAGGNYIYIGYKLANTGNPITNLVLIKSKNKITWGSKTLTVNGKSATYYKINIDLNQGAKGHFIYLCYTRDQKYDPLTSLDVILNSETLRDPWKIVTWDDSKSDADVNLGTKGSPIYIISNRKE